MSYGIAVALANAYMNVLRGVAPTVPAALWMKLHTGDPGAAGTANASVVTTRIQVTMNAASGGQITFATASGFYTMTATETITGISLWDASSGGNFLISMPLTVARNVVNLDTLSPTALTVKVPTTAIAA